MTPGIFKEMHQSPCVAYKHSLEKGAVRGDDAGVHEEATNDTGMAMNARHTKCSAVISRSVNPTGPREDARGLRRVRWRMRP